MEPFLRWAGGKRWLAPTLAPLFKRILNATGGTYFEPFLGSGSVFFSLAPQRALLSDINRDLIETYKAIAGSYRKVEILLGEWPNSSDVYYAVRDLEPDNPGERAARFIYLNRTCYGGIHRENRQGKFNTPYGGGTRSASGVLEKRLLQQAHFALSNVKLVSADFGIVLAQAGKGDVVYCDPTYTNVVRGGFDRYGATVFDWADQIRLARDCEAAMERGAVVVVSNGYFEDLTTLYPAAYRIRLERKKLFGKRARSQDAGREMLLILDPESRRSLWVALGDIENRKSRRRVGDNPLLCRERCDFGADKRTSLAQDGRDT